MKQVLVVGGSDSGGGAGIQADLKTLHSLGVHGSSVVTAVTAQSSTAVLGVHDVPGTSIRAQLEAVLDDLGADVVKTGMLPTVESVEAVGDAIGTLPLVVDPVGVSSTGQSLMTLDALSLLRSRLIPRALLITPNLAEVEALTGFHVAGPEDLGEAAERVHALGARWVLVKGGHLEGAPHDLLFDGSETHVLRGQRIDSPHTHGTGCTLATAVAAYVALGLEVPEAASRAKAFVAEAIRHGYAVGRGPGPVRQGA